MKAILLILFSSLLLVNSLAQRTVPLDSLKNIGDKYLSYDIKFGLYSEKIRSESHLVLDSLVSFLINHPNIKIEISNHCDERVSTLSATCLTCNRAKEMGDYLLSKGISRKRFTTRGYDASNPLINHAQTEEQHYKNRRSEFKVIDVNFSE